MESRRYFTLQTILFVECVGVFLGFEEMKERNKNWWWNDGGLHDYQCSKKTVKKMLFPQMIQQEIYCESARVTCERNAKL